MTFTLTSIRDEIEVELRDVSNVEWSTAQLDESVKLTLDRYTKVAPRPRSSALTGISGRTVTLSATAPGGLGTTDYAALIKVTSVEYPISQWPPRYVTFDVYADVLRMHVAGELVSEAVNVRFDSLHTLDGSGGTIPDAHRTAFVWGGVAAALRQRAIDATEALAIQPDYDSRLRRLADEYDARFRLALDGIRSERGIGFGGRYRPDTNYGDSQSIVTGPPG